jgi:hypothetical protein
MSRPFPDRVSEFTFTARKARGYSRTSGVEGRGAGEPLKGSGTSNGLEARVTTVSADLIPGVTQLTKDATGTSLFRSRAP